MTWLADLYETYEDNLDQVGQTLIRKNQSFSLLPVGHAYRDVQIEVQVTPEGNFYGARVLSKGEAPTIIPVTEKSVGGRTNSPVPHPLHDNLKYVAGDFEHYVETKGKKPTPHELYMNQLKPWAQKNNRIKGIYHYLKKDSLIKDLVKAKILYVDKSEKLILKWTKEMTEENGLKPELFNVLAGTQDSAMVRFTVHEPGVITETPIWEDPEIQKSAIEEFSEGQSGIDYITGSTTRITGSHASGLRYAGDSAKLISANDETNFTYRGRFIDKAEVASVSFEVSQKAHNALKWLITKQGIIRDGRVYLVWGPDLPETHTPLAGGNEFVDDDELEDDFGSIVDRTQEEFAKELKNSIYGPHKELMTSAKVNIMILDNATKGRMGILYYNSTNQKQYLERIEQWQQYSAWRHTYFKDKRPYHFYGAPNLYEIAKAAFGENANDKVLNNTTTALFTCVVEGKKVPFDLVSKLSHRVSNPQSFDQPWQWRKALGIACSMTNHYYFRAKGGCPVSLNKESEERNYLFGRLLAVSHVLENEVLKAQGASARATNAERYMNAFSMHPVKTWMIIRKNLQPYLNRLNAGKKIYYSKLFDEIMNQFDEKGYTDKALDGRYLLGYYSQEYDIYHKATTGEEE
ncbi:type I-C CRISPR-associated protein Cas8c/Csd1 [Enterococcus sp. 2201sp1_2201st1_B8_2201SCRN_220225]|uniref:type I-C CRISPR-associated protein Cas8c/Csd1 n=1 Tax=unclassified Enterococcus TaxID=2608891 RepID=UPI0034A30584